MDRIRIASSDRLSAGEMTALRGFLDEAFEGDFSDDDAAHALGGHHALIARGGRIVAHGALVPRTLWAGEREFAAGYVEAVAVAPADRQQGLGSAIMRALARQLVRRYEIGALSTGEPAFYARLGWERWAGPTYVRTAGALRRTPEEDDGIMVMRFGPSALADLHRPLVCLDRPGDAW